MKSVIEYFDCGYLRKDRESFRQRVEKFYDIENKIIPFFIKYPIVGVKAQDFLDFCRVVELIKENKHLTKDGLEQVRKIKEGMNRGRKLD